MLVALAGAMFSLYRTNNEAGDFGPAKYASAAAFALMGLFTELLGGALLVSLLDAAGITSPFARGLGLLLLDFAALSSAGYGLYLLLKKVPLEQGWVLMRKALVGLVSSTENLTTFISVAGVAAAIATHIDEYLVAAGGQS